MRGKVSYKYRDLEPDPRFSSIAITKFVNQLMMHGKKSVARGIFYDAMEIVRTKMEADPKEVFERAIKNVKPEVEVRSRRIGGATYQIPIPVRPDRAISLAYRWMISFARSRDGKSMAQKLANELMDAAKNVGGAVKKKEDTHRMAEANRAFSHFR